MKNLNISEPLKKGLVELARVVVLAVLPVVISALESGQFSVREILIVGMVALFKAVDKFLHKLGEQSGNDGLEKGLTRF